VVAALTFPGDAVGEVYANLRINDQFVTADTERGLREAGAATEPKARDVGDEWGRVSSESFGRRVGREAPAIAREVERGLRRQRIRLPDVDGNETGRRWSRSLGTGLAGAVAGSSIFNNIGRTISDAIGAGFNVSGRSPLIVLIAPLLGSIVALILAAVHGLHALIALLYSVPNILFAIGLQAGVLLLIFHNVGTAISAAFSAKNATELQAALKGLNPQLANFVKTLLPLKNIFKDLANLAQTKFFGAFDFGGTNPITDLIKSLTSLPKVVAQISAQFGETFRDILRTFERPEFNTFFSKMGDSAVRFLQGFTAGISDLIVGLTDFGLALIPFADKVGEGFNKILSKFGGWLTKLSNDKDFLNWLDRAFGVLDKLGDALYAIIQFFMTFAQVLDQTGTGDQLLVQLTQFIQLLSFLLQTEGGQKAIEGLVHIVLLLTAGFVGLIIVIGFVLAALESFFEWLKNDALPWLGNNIPKIGDAIGSFFTDIIPKVAIWLLKLVSLIISGFWELLMLLGTKIAEGLWWVWNQVVDFFKGLGPRLLNLVTGFGTLLFNAGKSLIQGLIDGVKSMFPNIGNIISDAAAIVGRFWPFSPAKEGPLSGSGDLFFAGQNIINRLVAGIEMQTPELAQATSNAAGAIYFGPGSVQVGFNGAVPTQQQAMTTGTAAGRGIVGALAARNTRLQVRTL
jgi:hypothetical protein